MFLSEKIVRSGKIDNIHLGLDFFDASINRIGAWIIGVKVTLKGLLITFLESTKKLKKYKENSDNFARLAFLEKLKTIPLGFIWDYYCHKAGISVEAETIKGVHKYGTKIMNERI